MRVWTGASNGAGGASQPTVRVKWDDGSVAHTAPPPSVLSEPQKGTQACRDSY